MQKNLDQDTVTRIKKIIVEFAEVQCDMATLGTDDNLFNIGMSSRASVNLMIGLESEFDIEFPDDMLRKEVFESVRAIASTIDLLTEKI